MPSRLTRVDRLSRDRAPVSRGGSGHLLTASLATVAGVMGVSLLTGWPAVRSAGAQELVQQVQVQLGGAAPDADGPAKENTEPVFVRDSAIAQEKMSLAIRMEKQKEWHKSADVYQEVLEKYHDRVIPVGRDAKNVINRYTSVSTRVLQQVCKWPQEGLDVYRGRYEPKAAELVNNAKPDDLFSLHKAFDLYFVTESGKQAGLRLIDAHLEKGEYAAAAWIGDQLLDMHPNLLAERPAVLFRTALAYHLAGSDDKARDRAGELSKKFAKEIGVVRGKDVVLADALTQELQHAASDIAAVSGSDSWPMMGGGPSRGVISSANPSAGTRLV